MKKIGQDGWIDKIDGWLDGRITNMNGWEKIDGWLDG